MNDLLRNDSGYVDITAYKAIKNIKTGENKMEVYKGEIWFVTKNNFKDSKSEDGYPAIIISNDIGNHFSNYVNVVRLTVQPKKSQPTHVEVEFRNAPAVALCENINTVAKDRLTDFVTKVTPEELAAIDKALMIALDISNEANNKVEINEANCKLRERIEQQSKLINDLSAENESLTKKLSVPVANEADMISLKTERDLYKRLYDQMLEKMIGA